MHKARAFEAVQCQTWKASWTKHFTKAGTSQNLPARHQQSSAKIRLMMMLAYIWSTLEPNRQLSTTHNTPPCSFRKLTRKLQQYRRHPRRWRPLATLLDWSGLCILLAARCPSSPDPCCKSAFLWIPHRWLPHQRGNRGRLDGSAITAPNRLCTSSYPWSMSSNQLLNLPKKDHRPLIFIAHSFGGMLLKGVHHLAPFPKYQKAGANNTSTGTRSNIPNPQPPSQPNKHLPIHQINPSLRLARQPRAQLHHDASKPAQRSRRNSRNESNETRRSLATSNHPALLKNRATARHRLLSRTILGRQQDPLPKSFCKL